MPLLPIAMTTLQFEAATAMITIAMDALARYEMVKNMNDAQCQVLIDNAKKTKAILDERLASH